MKALIVLLDDSEFEYQKALVNDYDLCSATSYQAYIALCHIFSSAKVIDLSDKHNSNVV